MQRIDLGYGSNLMQVVICLTEANLSLKHCVLTLLETYSSCD